jgi:hypothetical protein
MEKYLISRPEGGLNDMLSQLGRCVDYCLRHGRTLVIDTDRSMTFAAPFGRFFSIEHPALRVVTAPREFVRMAIERDFSVHPAHARLRPTWRQQPRYVEQMKNFCAEGAPVTFDFDRDHEATVLVHQQCGREPFDCEFMGCLRLSPRMRAVVERRWASLPRPYIGIHARNTDIKSDISRVMPLIRRYRGAVFLATDSAEVQREVSASAGRHVFMSGIPDFKGGALHIQHVTPRTKDGINTTAVADLLLLALAKRVYATTETSGYSALAQELNRNQRLVAAWMGRDLPSCTWPWLRSLALARGKAEGLLSRCGGR